MRYIGIVWMAILSLPVWGGEKMTYGELVKFITNGGLYDTLSPRSRKNFFAIYDTKVRKIEQQNPKSYQERKELYQVGKATWNAFKKELQKIEELYNQMLLEIREIKTETPTLSKYIDACLEGPTFIEQGIVDTRKKLAWINQQIKNLESKIQKMDKEMRREASLQHKAAGSNEPLTKL